MSEDVVIEEDAGAGRFEASSEGRPVGHLTYRVADGRMTIPHTEVDPAFRGRGVASRLSAAALRTARERGLSVLPSCAFVRAYLERHPEYRDLVD